MSNRFQRRTGRFRAGFGFALLLTVLILLALLCDPDVQSRLPWNQSRAPETQAEGELTVYFLDVGQGDAALLRSAGATMLIDGGPRDHEDNLLADLEELGVDHLDYMVATHPHEDHIGGLPGVMERITVEECWMPEDAADTWTYTHFLEALETHDVAVAVPQPGDTISFGSCTVTVLAPLSGAEEHNNNSLVLRVVCGETAFLFTGDMEDAEERELLGSGADPPAWSFCGPSLLRWPSSPAERATNTDIPTPPSSSGWTIWRSKPTVPTKWALSSSSATAGP